MNTFKYSIYTHKESMRFYLGLFFIVLILCGGCKKFVEVDRPVTSISSVTVYASNATAAAVMSGVYSYMSGSGNFSNGNLDISIAEGLASDELTNYYSGYAAYGQFYQNALGSTAGASNNYWNEIYRQIHMANTVIEGLAKSTNVTTTMKQQLDGEAKFIRAFYHFYATNIYGDVPLITTTDYPTNNTIKRTPQALVYKQIILDLKDAKAELGTGFLDANGNVTTERIRPNKAAAQALLARAYLYMGDWADAYAEADFVINNSNFTLLNDLTTVFKKNSGESIWQLPPVISGNNTYDAQYFVLIGPPGNYQNPFAISNTLVNAFEANDKRFSTWVGVYQENATTSYYYPYKYTVYQYGAPVSEYLTVFRLAEQYLIRAEAEANGAGSGLSAAVADLNVIRTRAGLPNYAGSTADKAAVLNAILHERQVELFTEWGHRWFDLIRTNNINSVMGSPGNVCLAKGGTWAAYKTLAPIPLSEIQINPNLTQNNGYQ